MRGLLLAGAVLALAACQSEQERQIVNAQSDTSANSSAPGVSRDFAQQGFTAIDLRGPDDVEVTTGPNFAVSAKGPNEVLDQLEISTANGVLVVTRKKGGNGNWLNLGNDATIHVVMPRLERISVSGSGDVEAERADGDFVAEVSGSGSASVKSLQGRSAKLSLGGSGEIELSGAVERVEVNVGGSGSVDADDLVAQNAEISVAGSGKVDAHATGTANISVAGSGKVDLKGGARCTIKKAGSGNAVCV